MTYIPYAFLLMRKLWDLQMYEERMLKYHNENIKYYII